MPRPLFDSEYLFGLHEPGGEQLMLDAGRPGWILFTEEVGRNPNDFSGKDFSPWSNRNLGVICRINHGYHPHGTIPHSAYYEDFARRCANYVANSQGCRIWIIGNETNFDVERPLLIGRGLASSASAAQARGASEDAPAASESPAATESPAAAQAGVLTRLLKAFFRGISEGMGDAELFPQPAPPPAATAPEPADDPFFHGDPRRFNALSADAHGAEMVTSAAGARGAARSASAPSEVITPELYARCYRLCRDAIRRVPGHANDQVLIGAVAPWNNQTQYPGNPNGDWVQYLQDILRLLGPNGCDGITLHTYTHGADPNLIHDAAKMNPPFQNRHYHFFAYRDFMNAIPANMRHLPVYITETDEDVPWLDQNIGWVQRAYAEINWWNNQPGNQQIRALILYRWPNIDRWVIETKPGVIADFREALRNDYRWRASQAPTPGPAFKVGDSVLTTTVVNLRRTPGTANKPANDILIALPLNSVATVIGGPRTVDNLIWWQLRGTSGGNAFDGWAAEVAPTGQVLLELNGRGATPAPLPGTFKTGDVVTTQTIVRLRRTPGITNKPENDVIADINQGVRATINGGPQTVDSLTWWRVATTNPANAAVTGWLAETAPGGVVLIQKVSGGTTPPPSGSFARGELVTTITAVRVRRTPGTTNKPDNDTLGVFELSTTLNVLEGPRTVDGLTWWRVGGITLGAGEVIGWVAEKDQTGAVLVAKPSKLPGTNIPDRAAGAYLGLPFAGNFGISQLWGENPQIYGRISYDGVPLKGHNGIDYLTPIGTTLLAVDGGVVQEAVHNDPTGFGHYVKLRHSWGESLYAHLDNIGVQAGQAVSRGQAIGRSGNTGFSDGPHLHFSIRINPFSRTDGWGGFSDPLPYMNPSQVQLPGYVQDAGARAAQGAGAARPERRLLDDAPGYAPDQPGVARP